MRERQPETATVPVTEQNSENFFTETFSAVPEDGISARPDGSHLAFARGYAFSRTRISVDSSWRELELDGYWLTWDPRLDVTVTRAGGRFLALIGHGIHVLDGIAAPNELVEQLCRARAHSWEAFLDTLEFISGRYVVIEGHGKRVTAQSDATGGRAVFYAPDGEVVSSHAAIVAESIGAKRSVFSANWRRSTKAFTFPGRSTEYDGVFRLTPNMALILPELETQRVFPRKTPRVQTAEEVARTLLPLLQTQARLIAQHRPVVSLSAGMDSRVTLAATRAVADKLTFFTYDRAYSPVASLDLDVSTATSMAKKFNLDHRLVHVPSAVVPQELKKVLDRNIGYAHSRPITLAYRSVLPLGRPHLRSNLYEIGRAFYRSRRRELPALDAESAWGLLTREGQDDAAVEAFEEFFSSSGLLNVPGYDVMDLFYWEHRMGVWLSTVLTETDVAHETYSLINSRYIIELMLSVPLEDRISSRVFDLLIAMVWPELLTVPVNGEVRPVPELGGAGS